MVWGNCVLQGPHQEPQKSISTTWPLCFATAAFKPLPSITEIATAPFDADLVDEDSAGPGAVNTGCAVGSEFVGGFGVVGEVDVGVAVEDAPGFEAEPGLLGELEPFGSAELEAAEFDADVTSGFLAVGPVVELEVVDSPEGVGVPEGAEPQPIVAPRVLAARKATNQRCDRETNRPRAANENRNTFMKHSLH